MQIATQWDGHDFSEDIAVLQLAAAPNSHPACLPVAATRSLTDNPLPAMLDALHQDRASGRIPQRSHGHLSAPPPGSVAARLAAVRPGSPKHPARLAVADFAAAEGSSGGPVRDAASGTVIGINHGRQRGGTAGPGFDPAEHYNLVVLLDQDIVTAILAARR